MAEGILIKSKGRTLYILQAAVDNFIGKSHSLP